LKKILNYVNISYIKIAEGAVKMDEHRIKVKNFVVAEFCFRKLGQYANYGNVVVDTDSYNFAGMITDEKIVGYYENKKYTIHYYKSLLDMQQNPITYQYIYRYILMAEHISYKVGFIRTEDIEKDFTNIKLIKAMEGYEIEFVKLCNDIKEAKRVFDYNYNQKILEVIR